MATRTPKILYHYCSLDTFLKIIENKKIWLSDVRKSNDGSELRCFKLECALQLLDAENKYIQKYSNASGFNYDFSAMDGINNLAQTVTQTDLFTTWVFCMSENPDLLSQWRGYADNGAGVCIGFDYDYLKQIHTKPNDDKGIMLQLRQVMYGEDTADSLLSKRIDIDNTPMDFDAFKQKCHDVFFSSFSEAPFYKNQSFSEECEWRIALTYLPEKIKALSSKGVLAESVENYFVFGENGYTIRDNSLVSHIELIFKNLQNAVKEIIIGPRCKTLTKEIQNFLISEGWEFCDEKEPIQIIRSSSSYR